MSRIAVAFAPLTEIPDVGDVRPCRCRSCRQVEGVGGRLLFHGHGQRWRLVAVAGDGEGLLVRAWQRRFLCTRCGATVLVVPIGLLPGFVYTLGAILASWFAAAPAPIGDGLRDEEVYAGHGVDRLAPDMHRATPRWASLERWSRLASSWWPSRPMPVGRWRDQVAALLIGFMAGKGGRDGAIARAVAAHAAAGAAV
jgi:hypothetical protein